MLRQSSERIQLENAKLELQSIPTNDTEKRFVDKIISFVESNNNKNTLKKFYNDWLKKMNSSTEISWNDLQQMISDKED